MNIMKARRGGEYPRVNCHCSLPVRATETLRLHTHPMHPLRICGQIKPTRSVASFQIHRPTPSAPIPRHSQPRRNRVHSIQYNDNKANTNSSIDNTLGAAHRNHATFGMVKVDLKASFALAGIIEADAADLAVHPETPLDEPADEIDAANGEAVDWVQSDEEMESQVEEGMEDAKEGHKGGIDDDFAKNRS